MTRKKCIVIADVGINHNGDLDIAKQLIDGAVKAGCDAVKFQKRTIEKVYSQDDLNKERQSPWGNTNRDQKNGIEFGKEEYDEINAYCQEKGIDWFASAWDIESQDFLKEYDLKYNKVASAMLTHRELLEKIASEKKHSFISTGMSTIEEITKALDIFKKAKCSYEIMHCNSIYPGHPKDANLNVIKTLQDTFKCDVGFSSHQVGIILPPVTIALGVTSIEAHITLDRSMYGSDQAASIEVPGFIKMLNYIRSAEVAMGISDKVVDEQEEKMKLKLRQVNTL